MFDSLNIVEVVEGRGRDGVGVHDGEKALVGHFNIKIMTLSLENNIAAIEAKPRGLLLFLVGTIPVYFS